VGGIIGIILAIFSQLGIIVCIQKIPAAMKEQKFILEKSVASSPCSTLMDKQ
jgi:hypothetical protein